MPIIVASIDPVTRIEGHLKVDIEVDTVGGVQQVTGVKTVGTLFRGFEKVLEGRDPRDAAIITSRICGVCPTSHAQAAVLALDQASGMVVPGPARILRNLTHGACFLESHILHFYLLSLPDYIQGLGMPPWTPGFEMDRRVDKATSDLFTAHYVEAITMRRRCHEIGSLFGGKLPHTPAYIAGGFTAVPSQPNMDTFGAGLDEILNFINTRYLPDVERLSSLYSDYFFIGRGYGNLLAYGAFELDGDNKLFQAGRIVNGTGAVQPMNAAAITEDVTHSWYKTADSGLNPAVGESNAQYPKNDAYSWLKAPRYANVPYECGPLARMTVNGEYTNGVSAMDRIRARAFEARKLALAMKEWLSELLAGDATVNEDWPTPVPANVSGMGLTEAPRGALGHWLSIGGDGKIARYQVITPTCWTISPRDGLNQAGPLEQALLGTPIANVDHPVEALRVIHSVDPCLDCATHVMQAKTPRTPADSQE